MFVVMGATGHTGGAAVRALLERGAAVRAVVRNPAKAADLEAKGAEVVVADATDSEALATAFAGAGGVYVMNPPRADASDIFDDTQRVGDAVAAALRDAQAPYVVLLSSEGAHLERGTGAIRTTHIMENKMRATEIPLSILRATYFMQNWGSVLGLARAQGILPSFRQPLDVKFEMISTEDIGRVAAELLLDSPPETERIVHLVGPEPYSPQDVARIASDLLGKPVQAVAPPREAWGPALSAAGIGPSYAEALADMYEGINSGIVRFEPGVGEMRRGRITLAETLRTLI